jgi:SAM-dependent methyltransferase
MDLSAFRWLLSAEGQRVLADTAVLSLTPTTHLSIAADLRRQIAPELAQAVLDTALLRQKATAKFSRANEMYFTREALEQASGEVIGAYRARRFAALHPRLIADLGCGVGGDALALAQIAPVVGVDLAPVRLAMARQNVQVYAGNGRFHPLQADLRQLAPLPADALFFDPARRDPHGRRLFSVYHYQPPLSLVNEWRAKVAATAVKISPGVDYAELPPDAEVEFISLDGEVKEGLLWFGPLHSGAGRRATLLPGGHTLTSEPGDSVPVIAPQGYLYEPDGAVIRAHLVEELARLLGAGKIDQEIAYLTAVVPQQTPFARCYPIEDAFPFQLKRLRHYLRQRQVGHVVIKKRGSPLEPEWLQKQLRLQGDEQRTLFLTQIGGKAGVVVSQLVL